MVNRGEEGCREPNGQPVSLDYSLSYQVGARLHLRRADATTPMSRESHKAQELQRKKTSLLYRSAHKSYLDPDKGPNILRFFFRDECFFFTNHKM